ncbi:MAG: T9SS type A sorting domain-containing protein [Ignavibacteriae bacterium]|nr:T9SS type A sorting domain-containing protein [Ignavibacteriota bacterium]
MKLSVKFTFLFLLNFSYLLIYAQDSNHVNYSLWLEKPVSFGTIDTKVDEGSFKEGEGFTIPETVLPSSPIDFSMYQDLYNALTGGIFSLEYGALDNDIIMKIFIRNLEQNANTYLNLGIDDDTLFSYFEIRIWELPDSNFYPEEASYYFNEGFHANFSLPKSDYLKNFLNLTGIGTNDSLAFAFLEEETINSKKVDDWNLEGIQTFETEDSVKFKAIHLSRIGGGRKRTIVNPNTDTTTGIKINQLEGIPQNFELYQNYPNPFNPSTKIKFSIPQTRTNFTSNILIKVYDILGREITTLLNERKQSGNYEITFNSSSLIGNKGITSGIYFYTMQVDDLRFTRKMILTK